MQYTEKELSKLIEDVEKEFTTHLTKAEELAKSEGTESTLAKAEDEKPRDEKQDEKQEEKQEHSEEPKHEEEEHAEKEHAMPPEHEKEASADGCDYDDEDLEHMHKMYGSMSKGELKAHHDAVRQALDASGMSKSEIEQEKPGHLPGKRSEASDANGDRLDKIKKAERNRGSGGQQSEQAPADAAGPRSEASKTHNEVLYKNDVVAQEPNNTPGGKSDASYTSNKVLYGEGHMEKSEKTEMDLLKSEFEAQKVKNETLQKTLDGVSEFLTKLVKKVNVPQGKAVTSYDVIAKSEDMGGESKELSKSEIKDMLIKKSMDPNLSKSDREAINNFYLNSGSLNSISHLLK